MANHGLFSRLSHEWQAYISRVHKLRKVFISVKGIYYQVPQPLLFTITFYRASIWKFYKFLISTSLSCLSLKAEIEGQKVTWLTPHALQQVLPEDDVDFNVMLTFLEVYEVSLWWFFLLFVVHTINLHIEGNQVFLMSNVLMFCGCRLFSPLLIITFIIQ